VRRRLDQPRQAFGVAAFELACLDASSRSERNPASVAREFISDHCRNSGSVRSICRNARVLARASGVAAMHAISVKQANRAFSGDLFSARTLRKHWSAPSAAMRMLSRSKPSGARDKRDKVVYVNHPPSALLSKLRAAPGKNIWLMGGGELARSFLQEDLVDGVHLGIVPVLLGDRIPLFPSGFPQRDFTLAENKSYSKGVIGLKYNRARQEAKRTRSKRGA
jgi:dihydrofolate reductase